MCGSLVEEDVALRLRKVQILNSLGREETAIAAYHVSDGLDQCHVGFLQCLFVAHVKTFDGALAKVTEVYGAGSKCTVKQKKWQHNRGCCLATFISGFPPPAQYTSTATNTFLAEIAKRDEEDEEDEAEEMSGQNEVSFVLSYDDTAGASINRKNTSWFILNVWLKHFINPPHKHCFLVHPSILLSHKNHIISKCWKFTLRAQYAHSELHLARSSSDGHSKCGAFSVVC